MSTGKNFYRILPAHTYTFFLFLHSCHYYMFLLFVFRKKNLHTTQLHYHRLGSRGVHPLSLLTLSLSACLWGLSPSLSVWLIMIFSEGPTPCCFTFPCPCCRCSCHYLYTCTCFPHSIQLFVAVPSTEHGCTLFLPCLPHLQLYTCAELFISHFTTFLPSFLPHLTQLHFPFCLHCLFPILPFPTFRSLLQCSTIVLTFHSARPLPTTTHTLTGIFYRKDKTHTHTTAFPQLPHVTYVYAIFYCHPAAVARRSCALRPLP